MKNILFLLLLNLLANNLSAQVSIEWSTFNTTLGISGLSLQKDAENRMYIYSESPVKLIRINTEGDTVWSRSPSYQILSMDLDPEGNILTIGRSYVDGLGYYWKFNKWDSLGNVLWTQQIGPSTYHEPRQIKSDAYSNVYVTGIGQFDRYTIAKYYPNGVQDWIYAYPPIDIYGENCGYDIEVTDTTQIYTVGKHGYNMLLLKLNHLGDTIWTRKFRRNIWMGIPTYSNDRGIIIESDLLGNVYVQNKTLSQGYTQTIKYNSNGLQLWVREHNPSLMATPAELIVEPDGTNYFFGHSSNPPIQSKIKIDKRNANGDLLYNFEYINPDGLNTYALGGYVKNGNAYACGGTTTCNGCNEDIVVVKVNNTGTLEWDHLHDTEAYSGYDAAKSLIVDDSGAVYVTGSGAPVNQEYVHTFKLFECGNIDYGAAIINDTLWANSNGYQYRWLNCNNNYSPLTGWNSQNYFVPTSLGSYAVVTKNGTCIDTSDCLVTGYWINDYDIVCVGENYTFPDGTVVNDVIIETSHFNYLTSGTGLDSTIYMYLDVYPEVDITVTQNQNTLTATATFATYQWVDCLNGFSAVPDQISNIFMSPTDGEYAAIITQYDGCSDTSECFTVNYWGLNEIVNNNELTIYPNPTSGVFTILSSNDGQFSVYDVAGRYIMDGKLNEEVDISKSPSGVYLIKIAGRVYRIISY